MHALSRSAFAAAAPFILSALLSTTALAQEAQPAPAAPSVAFSSQLVAAASAFETYTGKAGAIRADFADGGALNSALQTGSAYEPKQIQAGEIAYAAIVALQDPAFVDGAQRWARSRRRRRTSSPIPR